MWFANWFTKPSDPLPAPKKDRLKILILSMFMEDRFVMERLAKQHDWDLCFAHTEEGLRLLSQSAFAVVLFDRNQLGNPWREVLDRLAEASPQSCILLVSPVNDDYLWREVLHHGGYGVVTRPLRVESVLPAIQAAAHFAMPATRSS